MDTILVISDEPALAETLASELAECSVEPASLKEAAARLQTGTFRLILADEGVDEDSLSALPAGAKTPLIRLTRPARLRDLLYTIRERLQSKSAPAREELPFAPGWRLCPAERQLREEEGAGRIVLTEKEVELLLCLRAQQGKPIAREALLKAVWGYGGDVTTHTLETHVYRLRGKLRQASESVDIIFAGEEGYRLKMPAT